jgi:hypothetical protein
MVIYELWEPPVSRCHESSPTIWTETIRKMKQRIIKLFASQTKDMENDGECNIWTFLLQSYLRIIFDFPDSPTYLQCYKSDVLSGFRSNKINKAAGILQTRSFKHLDGKKRWVMLGSRWSRGRGAHENHEKGWFSAGRLESLIRAQWNELPVAHFQWWFCKDVVGCRRMLRIF